MEDVRKEDEVVLEEEQQDELDNWFDEDPEEENDEDLSAEDDAEEEEESSPSDDSEELDPDDEDQSEDAAAAASEEGTSTKTQSEENPYAWMEELDSDLRDKVERLVQSDRSQKGRVAALQRQLDSVRAEQEARARTQPQVAAQAAAAAGKNLEDMDDEELAEFLEEFPSVAKNVQKLIDRRLEEEISRRVQPIEQERLQQRLEADRHALRQEAQRIFNTVETGIDLDDVTSSPAFSQWLSQQPTEYQNFARSAESVPAAAKVLEDFAMYTEEQVAAMMEEAGEGGADETQTQEQSRSADQTAARRREARQGATPRSKSAQLANKPGQGSYEDWFDHFVEGGN